MNVFKSLTSLALLALVQASIYVTDPVQSTVCHGGQSCDVEWVDNGQAPLLSSIGECTIGLYNGDMVLVQSLSSVDVSSAHSLSFTPNPSVGPVGSYYLVFTSNSITYQAWSATFTLDDMTGSAADSGSGTSTTTGTSTSASSPASTGSGSSTTTSTGTETGTDTSTSTGSGTVSTTTSPTSATTPTTSVTASGFTTSTTPSSTPSTSTHTSTSSTSSPSATQSGAALRAGPSTYLAGGLFLALAGALAF